MASIKNIEIEEPPYSEEYLDNCLNSIDLPIILNFAPNTNQFKAYLNAIKAIEGEGVGKVIYIHSYPEELRAIVGVKIVGEIPK